MQEEAGRRPRSQGKPTKPGKNGPYRKGINLGARMAMPAARTRRLQASYSASRDLPGSDTPGRSPGPGDGWEPCWAR